MSAGEKDSDNDLVVTALSSLPSEFDMVKTVILARDTSIPFKDFRAQLLGAESTIEARITSLTSALFAMYVQGKNSEVAANRNRGGYQCHNNGFQKRFQNGPDFNNADNRSQNRIGSSSSNFYSSNRNGYAPYNNYRPHFGNKSRWNNFGGSQYSGGFKSNWNGNTNFKSSLVVECQICSKKGHTAPKCLNMSVNGQSSAGFQILTCQICG